MIPLRHARRSRIAQALALATTLFAMLGCNEGAENAAENARSERPPHIVLIVLDTVRADSVGGQIGDVPVTPTFDRIAREGTRFDRAYAVAPWTLPSHATLFTGLAPSQHQARHENFVLGREYLTLAEILEARGYATHAISSNPWVTRSRGLGQGFDHFDLAFKSEGDRAPMTDKGARIATDLAIARVEAADPSGPPLFLFVNYLEAHLPYAPPDEAFEALGIDPTTLARREFSIREAEEIMTGAREGTVAEFELARTLYRAEIAYQDRQLGRLIDALEARGLLDESLLVITADHGEAFGREGMTGHEFTLSDDVLSVPLVFRYPGRVPVGARVALPVSHLDVMPTLLHAIDAGDSAADLEGKDILDTQSLSLDRPLLAEYSHPITLREGYWKSHHPDFDTSDWAVSLRSYRKAERKLVENSRGEVTLIDPERPDDARPDEDRHREDIARSMRDEMTRWFDRLEGTNP